MSSFTKIGTSVLAGLMLATVAGSAGAHERASSRWQSTGAIQSTQAKADAARSRAADLARQGGWAYKTGAVDRANAEAARYQAEADAAQVAMPAEQPLVSPELGAAQERLADLRQAGGWAYKTGAVARAEADVTALTGPAPVTMGLNETTPPSWTWGKPVEKTLHVYR